MDLISSYYLISFSLGAISCIVCGFIVYRADHRKPVNISYTLLGLASGIWSAGYFLIITADNHFSAWVANLILHNGAIFIAPLFFQFILAYTNKLKEFRKILIAGYVSAVVVSVITPTSYFVVDVVPKFVFNYTPLGGELFFLFVLHFWWLIFVSFYVLLKSLTTSTDRFFRKQGLFIAIASILGFIGGGSTFLYSLNINIPPYPIILFFFYPIVIAYAILKHKLFNAKLIATEFITFSLWIFTFIRAVISKGTDDNIISWVFFGLMVFVGLLLIRSVRKEVEAKEEIERLAKDLTVANERLKELDKLKSEFVSIASHQLRSPLTAIKGYASLIMDGSYGKVPETIREVINKMYQASQSLVVMVEDFLNVSRIEQGRMKFELELTDLEDVIKKVISEQSLSVERAGLKLTYSNDHQSPYMVVVDTGKIRQVITNLIDNAIKYTPKGSIAVCLSKNTKKGKIIISVADTGMGIDKETVPTLFAKFIRAKGANKVNVIGTGLGLYVVKEIVNGHHGRAWVESEGKGKGSTFFVELEEDYNTSHAIKVANFAKTM